jgi:glycosyltransferase involved in cell wall biosynthesis
MSGSDRIAALVRDLGLEAAVYMPDAWAPYDDRIQLVCEADVGVSAHPPTLEARFAFRTRMLDYVWAECPVVCSSGDVWADRIAAEGLGETVDACDPDQWAAALGRVVERGRDAYKPALARVAEQLRWSEVVRPLSRLVTASQPAGGHGGPVAWSLAFRHAVGRSARSIQSRQP